MRELLVTLIIAFLLFSTQLGFLLTPKLFAFIFTLALGFLSSFVTLLLSLIMVLLVGKKVLYCYHDIVATWMALV